MSDPRVTVELLARADLSVKAVLTEAWGKQWQDVINDCGFGQVTLANDDPNLALVEYGDFLRFSLDGVNRFMSIVEQKDRVDIATGEEVDENTVLSGRGTLACLEGAVVFPDNAELGTLPFADTRSFNFGSKWIVQSLTGSGYSTSGLYDFGAWAAAGPNYAGMPTDWPDPLAHWVGPQAPDGSGDDPVGDWYLLSQTATIPTGRYQLWLGWDDGIDLYIDDVPLLKADSSAYGTSRVIDLQLTSPTGDHTLSFKITNAANPSPNPTGLIASLIEVDETGALTTVRWRTEPAMPYYLLAYPPAEPGLTVGQVMIILIDEFQDFVGAATDRDSVPLLTFDFTMYADSAGVTWADEIQPSFQIGMDMLTVVKQLCETYCEPRMDPTTLNLSLYQSLGQASAAAYVRGENITELRHTGKT